MRNVDSIHAYPHSLTRVPSTLFVLVASLLVTVFHASAEEAKMDEALRGRDMGKILNILKTSEPAEAPPAAATQTPPVQPVKPEPKAVVTTPAPQTDEASTLSVRKTVPGPRVTHRLPADLPGASSHHVTVVSSDGGVEDLATAAADADNEAAETQTRSTTPMRPGRIGAQSAIPTRIPKLEKRAERDQPDIEDRAQVDADTRDAMSIPNGLDQASVEKPDRLRALGELESLRESMPVGQTNSLIPSDEAPVEKVVDTPADSVPAAELKPEKTEESERPLSMLDILAKRFGRTPPPPPERATDTIEPTVDKARPEAVPSTLSTPPSSAASSSLDVRSGEINEIRGAIDTLLRDVQQDASQQTGQPTGDVSSAPAHAGQGWRYVGSWRDGKMDGSGELTYPDGWKFDGEWREGRMHGTGTLMHPDGWMYQGGWSLSTMDGHGVLTYPDGWQYIGEWRAGRMHGTGELLHPQARRASAPKAP